MGKLVKKDWHFRVAFNILAEEYNHCINPVNKVEFKVQEKCALMMSKYIGTCLDIMDKENSDFNLLVKAGVNVRKGKPIKIFFKNP